MPDQTWETVSASQAPALVNRSPYCSRRMLWEAWRKRDRSLIETEDDERIRWGRLLQDDILAMTAAKYRLEVRENTGNDYARRGPLGATIDGLMIAPGQGRVVVEAKNIDWLRWRDTWTKTQAAPHVEIQTQVGMYAAEADHAIIAAMVGGNDLRFYERELDRELIAEIEEQARQFLVSVETGNAPDWLTDEMELPVIAKLWPKVDEREVVEDMSDALALAIRQFDRARGEKSFATKLAEQMAVTILATSGSAGVLRANGYTCYIKKSEVPEAICEPHTVPKVIRKGHVRTLIEIVQTARVEGESAPEPTLMDA
jgi:hypothetical protein